MTKREWERERAETERMEDAAQGLPLDAAALDDIEARGYIHQTDANLLLAQARAALRLRAELAAQPYESEGELAATVVALRAELERERDECAALVAHRDSLLAERDAMRAMADALNAQCKVAERERDEADYAAELTVQQFGWLSKSHTKNFQDVAASQAQVAALREALADLVSASRHYTPDTGSVAVAERALATPHDDSSLRALCERVAAFAWDRGWDAARDNCEPTVCKADVADSVARALGERDAKYAAAVEAVEAANIADTKKLGRERDAKVRAEERERCAKVADDALSKWDANCKRPKLKHSGPSYAAAVGGAGAAADIAAAIRALPPQEVKP